MRTLLVLLVTDLLTGSSGLSRMLHEKAKHLLVRILLPRRINSRIIESYFRKALRTKAWYALKSESKALILALRRWGHYVRSFVLTQILYEIMLTIELHTLKGRAIYYGIILALKKRLAETDILKNITQLLITGIFYLNNPPALRIYG